ncbi:MAG TPA: cell wall-binding protein, partial [Clostridia bacterium]
FKGMSSIIWGVQEFVPEQIIGKVVDYYYADVKNHPLIKYLKLNDESIRITIMKSDSKIIGGYSSVNFKELMLGPNVYSLDGKTLEEFTGKDFQTWRENWSKKYN